MNIYLIIATLCAPHTNTAKLFTIDTFTNACFLTTVQCVEDRVTKRSASTTVRNDGTGNVVVKKASGGYSSLDLELSISDVKECLKTK